MTEYVTKIVLRGNPDTAQCWSMLSTCATIVMASCFSSPTLGSVPSVTY
jgi:hypothetical protein